MRQRGCRRWALMVMAAGLIVSAGLIGMVVPATSLAKDPVIVDHRHTDLAEVPLEWIQAAKRDLHIAYGHTSHGSQITTGMAGLTTFAGAPHGGATYAWNDGGTGGALDLADTPFSGAADLGNPDLTAWASATRRYLNAGANADVNVVMWSWCGQVSYASKTEIDTYLSLMNGLEKDYPHVRFVYMTGHTDGGGLTGNLHLRNQQIRDYCAAHDKILYDFADIESYDPDGRYFGDKHVTDSCGYDGGNWAIEWQDSHTEGTDWYDCDSAHSQPLNANLKAYAAWWLWARLAGWDFVAPFKPTLTLQLRVPKSGVLKLGRRFTVKGTVTPASLAGEEITLTLQRYRLGKWRKVAGTRRAVGAGGVYAWRYRPAAKGSYRVRAAIKKTLAHTAAVTSWKKLRVR